MATSVSVGGDAAKKAMVNSLKAKTLKHSLSREQRAIRNANLDTQAGKSGFGRDNKKN